MIRLALLAAVLSACASDRERDCAAVRAILEPPGAPPRRTYDDKSAPQIRDESLADRLRKLEYRDAAVKRAVDAMLDQTGWTFYSPYDTTPEAEDAADRLGKLCGLQRTMLIVH